jgi:hypothetical protein
VSDTPHFSPELEGLLREVAADPRSVLLRVPRLSPLRSLLARQEPLRPSATGLGALDRHLLAVHRDELSQALLEACLVRLYSNPDWSLSVHRTRTATEDWVVESPRDWAERTREKAEILAATPTEFVGLDLLQACIEPGGLDAVSITQLARASLRLAPGATARAWIAFEMRLVGRFADAIRLVDQQLAEHVEPSLAAALLEYRAGAFSLLGDFQAASQDTWRAHLEDRGRVSALVNSLYCALRAGDREAARRAGSELDVVVTQPTPGILEHIDLVERFASEYRAEVPSVTRSIAHAQLSEAGPLTRRILHVYS